MVKTGVNNYDAFSEFTNGTTNDVHFVGRNNFLKQKQLSSKITA